MEDRSSEITVTGIVMRKTITYVSGREYLENTCDYVCKGLCSTAKGIVGDEGLGTDTEVISSVPDFSYDELDGN